MRDLTKDVHLGLSMLDVNQVASIFRLHPESVRYMVRAGRLPARKIGKRWLFTPQAIERFMLGEDPQRTVAHAFVNEPVTPWISTNPGYRGQPDMTNELSQSRYRNALASSRGPTRRKYRVRR